MMSGVAGIDVGGDKKGCHLVVLKGTSILCSVNSKAPEDLVQVCAEHDVVAVGIDSPCQWRSADGARQAERELARKGNHLILDPYPAARSLQCQEFLRLDVQRRAGVPGTRPNLPASGGKGLFERARELRDFPLCHNLCHARQRRCLREAETHPA